MEKTLLDMQGGTCTSCSIAIEHFAKRLKGISFVEVDRGKSRIYLEHDGDQANVDKVIEMVQRIGYDAWPAKQAEADQAAPASD
ncbi:MAG: heavy-metal-associated domain-containing protein [Spirochaetaceae bacterium]|nr:MAG: heavy-metal-associated domain-containing protein [Spirochaetaceae bacterium]